MLTYLRVSSGPCLGRRIRGHGSCLRACCNGKDGSVLKGQLTLCSKFISAAVRSKQACTPYGLAVLLLLPLLSALASAPGSRHSPCGWVLQLLWFVSWRAGHSRCLPSFHHVIKWRPNFDLLRWRTKKDFYVEIKFDALIWRLRSECVAEDVWITQSHVSLDVLDSICFPQVFPTPTWTFQEERSKVLPLHRRSYRTKTPITAHLRPTPPFPHPWRTATRSPMVKSKNQLCQKRDVY